MKFLLVCLPLVVALVPSIQAQTNDPATRPGYFGQRAVPQEVPTPTSAVTPAPEKPPFFTDKTPRPAVYLITTTEDFVVNVYLNGKPVPMTQRERLVEIYGSIVEKTKIEVKPGDWVVFNAANDRMRWGTCYFGAAGVSKEGQTVFVSRLSDPRWTCCDDLNKVGDFIAQRDSKGEAVRSIPNLWEDGPKQMAGQIKGWNGDGIWGKTPNTWIKFVYR